MAQQLKQLAYSHTDWGLGSRSGDWFAYWRDGVQILIDDVFTTEIDVANHIQKTLGHTLYRVTPDLSHFDVCDPGSVCIVMIDTAVPEGVFDTIKDKWEKVETYFPGLDDGGAELNVVKKVVAHTLSYDAAYGTVDYITTILKYRELDKNKDGGQNSRHARPSPTPRANPIQALVRACQRFRCSEGVSIIALSRKT